MARSSSAHSPLLGLEIARFDLFFLQPPAHLLQLDEGAGGRVGRHGGILNERVRRQHVVPLHADTRMRHSRSLPKTEAASVVVRGSLGPGGAPKTQSHRFIQRAGDSSSGLYPSSLTRRGFSCVEPFLFAPPSATAGSSGSSPRPQQLLACRRAGYPHFSWQLV